MNICIAVAFFCIQMKIKLHSILLKLCSKLLCDTTKLCLFEYLQSCTKLVGTHALLIIITFIIKMYVYIMTCMIQYPCSKHASSPSPRAMLVYTCLSFIPSALSLTTLILGSGEQSFYTKCPNSFVQDCSIFTGNHFKLGLSTL